MAVDPVIAAGKRAVHAVKRAGHAVGVWVSKISEDRPRRADIRDLRKAGFELQPLSARRGSTPQRRVWGLLGLVVGGVAISCALLWALWSYFEGVAPGASVFDRMRSAVTALGVITIGAGAVIAFRRQVTLEHQLDLDRAKEDRSGSSELHARYQQAAGQLGDERAMIRIAGVYALEALAGEWGEMGNRTQRDVCIDLLCGYLRSATEFAAEGARGGGRPRVTMNKDEADVRRTITIVIARHLRADHLVDFSGSWSDHHFDLTGATFAPGTDFTQVLFVRPVKISGAYFLGDVTFDSATFTEGGDFRGSTFLGPATFDESGFGGDTGCLPGLVNSCAMFSGASFDGGASFQGAFLKGANFESATAQSLGMRGAEIEEWGRFTGLRVEGSAAFVATVFHDSAEFDGATFGGDSFFGGADFRGTTDFRGATFGGDSNFSNAEFTGPADFTRTTFGAEAMFDSATFSAWVSFNRARFGGRLEILGAKFVGPSPLEVAHVRERFLTDDLRRLGAEALAS